MNRLAAVGILVLLGLALAPAGEAALNRPHGFTTDAPVLTYPSNDRVQAVSGAIDAEVPTVEGALLVHKGTLVVEGLDRVCWTIGTQSGCTQHQEGAYTSRLVPGGSSMLSFPHNVSARLTAGHAFTSFLDLRSLELGGQRPFEDALVSAVHDGRLELGGVGPIADEGFTFSELERVLETMGAMAPVGPGSTLEVLRDGEVLHVVPRGGDNGVAFTGRPEVAPMTAEVFVLPYEADLEVAWTAPSSTAARNAITVGRAVEAFGSLSGLDSAGNASDGGAGAADDLLGEFLTTTYLDLPMRQEGDGLAPDLANAVIVRFGSLEASPTGDGRMAFAGSAALEIQEGDVQEAPAIVGFGFVKLPWWGWALWVLAIGSAVAVRLRHAPKENERWDPYKWVGLAAGGVLFLLVLWLWDLEMRAVWGTSALTTSAEGTGFWVVFGIQMATLAMLVTLITAPLAMVVRNGLRLGGQGTFMGLAWPMALVVSFLLGATLLLSYLHLALQAALGA